jgi:hypothetical protein
MAKPRLHLDADISDANLEKELLKRGHDVTRTPNEWAASDADDETQLLAVCRRESSFAPKISMPSKKAMDS